MQGRRAEAYWNENTLRTEDAADGPFPGHPSGSTLLDRPRRRSSSACLRSDTPRRRFLMAAQNCAVAGSLGFEVVSTVGNDPNDSIANRVYTILPLPHGIIRMVKTRYLTAENAESAEIEFKKRVLMNSSAVSANSAVNTNSPGSFALVLSRPNGIPSRFTSSRFSFACRRFAPMPHGRSPGNRSGTVHRQIVDDPIDGG